jgi:signal transduction histidine kinase
VNRDLRITGANKQWDAFALAHGGAHLTRDHVLGTHLLDQMSGAPLQRWRTLCRQLLAGELPRYLDEIASQEPWAWQNYSLRATPLRDSQDSILGITFVATNITQLKRAEHEMFRRLVEIRGLRQVAQTAGTWADRRKVYKQITADIAHLFDAEHCVIFLWDEHTGNLQAQDPAFGLAGRRLAALSLDMGHPSDPGSLWLDVEEKDYILLAGPGDALADAVGTLVGSDRVAAMLGILRVSGRIHGALLVAGRDRPFSNQDGRLLAHLAVPTALSIENAELNRRLLDRTYQLATTQEQFDRLTKITEATRTPLSLIRGYLELLRDGALGPLPKSQWPTLQTVLDNTMSIIGLFSQVPPPPFLHGARRYEQLCVADLVRLVVERRLLTIKSAGVDLVTQLPARHDEETTTIGDPDMLLRVFDTLLVTVVKLGIGGGNLRVATHASEGVIFVGITGAGSEIPAQRLLRIWKPQRHPRLPKSIELAEVKRIVEGHGGQVWAESTPDHGSTFHVILPKLPH